MADNYKVSLSTRSSEKLDQIAQTLGVSKKEVIEKSIKLMELYAQNQDDKSDVAITVKKENGEVDNYVLL